MIETIYYYVYLYVTGNRNYHYKNNNRTKCWTESQWSVDQHSIALKKVQFVETRINWNEIQVQNRPKLSTIDLMIALIMKNK